MKILVVDDDLTNRLVLKAMLEKEGHEVVQAENGRIAVEVCLRQIPDMILMDVMMPEMDGYEATRRIKERITDIFVPVIFVTAIADSDALAKCIDAGGDDFITKPFNRIILRAKIIALRRIKDLYSTVRDQNSQLESHQQRIHREHLLGEKIFDSIVYRGNLDAECFCGYRRPTEMFSGDVMLTALTPSGGMNILVGDVTGHGLSAAICVLPVAEIFYSMSAKGFLPQHILSEINTRLHDLLPTGMFLAAAFVHADPEGRAVYIWNGGIPDILLLEKKTKSIRHIESSNLPLGILSNDAFQAYCNMYEISKGDRVVIYTDGLIEAENEEGLRFGENTVEELLQRDSEPRDFIDIVCERFGNFVGDNTVIDDVTILDFTCNPDLFGINNADVKSADSIHARTWNLRLELEADTIKSSDPLPYIIQLITGMQEMHAQRSSLFTILSELYNNAIDHGVLKLDSSMKNSPDGFMKYYQEREKKISELDSGRIVLEISNTPNDQGALLQIRLLDSGEGFEARKVLDNLQSRVAMHGRGIALLGSLCNEISYSDKGNEVKVKYQWR